MSRLRVFKPQNKNAAKPQKKWRETLIVESLADDGRGVARRQGKVVFVDGALPGETVVAELAFSSKRFDVARLIEVVEKSPERVTPACEHYDACGGCQVQHLSESAQMQWKSERFANLLARLKVESSQPPITGQMVEYRHRLRLFIDKSELGFRQRASHQLIAVPHCRVARPALAQALKSLYEHPEWLRLAYAGEVELVEDDQARVAALLRLAKKPTHAGLEKLKTAFPLDLLEVTFAGQAASPGASGSPELTYPGSDLRFCAGDFTQVNPAINHQLISQVMEWLTPQPDDEILDAFSGLGNFSIPLARAGARVTGLELDKTMVDRAAEQARQQGLNNLSYLERDLFAAGALSGLSATKAVFDPPRAGAKALCEALPASQVSRLVYVSCDPATLERDLTILLDSGFQILAARWADMFPQTSHMECLVLLTRET